MLRRALRRARLHLPAGSVGQEDAERPVDHAPSAEGPSVAHASLAFDADVDAHFRRQREDLAGIEDLLRALRPQTAGRSSIESVGDEAQRAADAWTRLQRLYGLFRALEGDEREPEAAAAAPGRDQGLRSLLGESDREPAGVMLRELHVLPRREEASTTGPPLGFSADVFLSLGDALYAEMVAASASNQRHRFDGDALRELGDTLYAEAASQAIVPVSAC